MFTSLPSELVERVWDKLPTSAQGALRCTCKAFRGLDLLPPYEAAEAVFFWTVERAERWAGLGPSELARRIHLLPPSLPLTVRNVPFNSRIGNASHRIEFTFLPPFVVEMPDMGLGARFNVTTNTLWLFASPTLDDIIDRMPLVSMERRLDEWMITVSRFDENVEPEKYSCAAWAILFFQRWRGAYPEFFGTRSVSLVTDNDHLAGLALMLAPFISRVPRH